MCWTGWVPTIFSTYYKYLPFLVLYTSIPWTWQEFLKFVRFPDISGQYLKLPSKDMTIPDNPDISRPRLFMYKLYHDISGKFLIFPENPGPFPDNIMTFPENTGHSQKIPDVSGKSRTFLENPWPIPDKWFWNFVVPDSSRTQIVVPDSSRTHHGHIPDPSQTVPWNLVLWGYPPGELNSG